MSKIHRFWDLEGEELWEVAETVLVKGAIILMLCGVVLGVVLTVHVLVNLH